MQRMQVLLFTSLPFILFETLQFKGNKFLKKRSCYQLFYFFLFHFLFLHFTYAQCAQPDAGIWQNTWASCAKKANPIAEYGNTHWIQYNFGSVQNLSQTWVWNTNASNQLNQGFNQVKIDYSEDGENWVHWGKMTFPKAKGTAVYSGFAGPNLENIQAQYVLLTAINNHGHPTCAGLGEIKFNLKSQDIEVLPTNNEDTDEDIDDGNASDDDFACAAINEIILEEVTSTEAFLYWEFDADVEDVVFLFEYQTEGGESIQKELEEPEIFLDDLQPNTTYEYRVSIECGDDFVPSAIQSFQTASCGSIGEIFVEDLTESEAFLIWKNPSDQAFFLVEIGITGDKKEVFEIEEPEVYLDDLASNTQHELRIGIECGEAIIWSELVTFKTKPEDLDLSTSINNKINSAESSIHLFPNPTLGKLTLRLKTAVKDSLNYSISNLLGQTLFNNTTQLHSGINDIILNLTDMPDGTYWLHGTTLNQQATIHQQIVKVNK